MSKVNEVIKSLYDLSRNELEIVRKECSRLRNKSVRDQLKVGSEVFLTREGSHVTYIVTKINPKNVIIKANNTNTSYNCSPALLEVLDNG